MNPVLDYVLEKGWQHRFSGDEIILKHCVFCGASEWKLYLNQQNRLYHCKRASCGAQGHISTLKKQVGDVIAIEGITARQQKDVDYTDLVAECHNRLLEDTSTLRYLDDNGITLDVINRFSLGKRKKHGHMWLVYPSSVKGVPRYIKYRLLPFDHVLSPADKEAGITKFWREKDAHSIMFNQDALDLGDEIIITEGEKDAISLLNLGFDNVVGTTGGADTLKSDWYDVLTLKKKIYLAFDNDENKAGYKGASKWAARLGYSKCVFVELPKGIKDITEFVLDGRTKEEFEGLLMTAKKFELPGIRSLITVLHEMEEQEDDELFLPTPWEELNELINKGFRPGDLVVLSAPPGIGKTTLGLQITAYYTKRVKPPIPSLFFCMEMTAPKLAQIYMAQALDTPWKEVHKEIPSLLRMQFEDVPVFFGFAPRITTEQLMHTFREARDRFGVGFFVFDNLHTLIRETDRVTERVGSATKQFKELAMELEVPILLIAQPRKMESSDKVMFYYDIRDSSSIPADADIVLLMHRNRTKLMGEDNTRAATFEDQTRLIVDKSRESSGGEIGMLFEPAYRSFRTQSADRNGSDST